MTAESDIVALVHAYGFLLDEGDIEGVVALFEHATWRSDASDAIRRGPAEIRPVYENLLASLGTTRTRHLLTNVTVTVAPGGHAATSRCYWTVLRAGPGTTSAIALSGQYLDRFLNVNGTWQFDDRFIMTDPSTV